VHIKALRDEGVSVVFIEHDMDVIMDISDWIVVMAEGKVIAEGRPGDVAANPAVIDAYLGRHHGEAATADSRTEVIDERSDEDGDE
jgi:branched-chain amino acid transport system ATP-binding protein